MDLAPIVDPPVSRLNKLTTIPVEGDPAFKDPADKKAEAITRNLYMVVGSAVRPTIVGALVSHTHGMGKDAAQWVTSTSGFLE